MTTRNPDPTPLFQLRHCGLLVVIVHKLLFVVSVKINHADLVA